MTKNIEQIQNEKVTTKKLLQIYKSLPIGTIVEVYDRDTDKELVLEKRVDWRTGLYINDLLEFVVFKSPNNKEDVALKLLNEKITRKNRGDAIEGDDFLNSLATAIFEQDAQFTDENNPSSTEIIPEKIDAKVYFKIVAPRTNPNNIVMEKDNDTKRIEKYWSQRIDLAREIITFINQNPNKRNGSFLREIAYNFQDGMAGNITIPTKWYVNPDPIVRLQGLLFTVIKQEEDELKAIEKKIREM